MRVEPSEADAMQDAMQDFAAYDTYIQELWAWMRTGAAAACRLWPASEQEPPQMKWRERPQEPIQEHKQEPQEPQEETQEEQRDPPKEPKDEPQEEQRDPPKEPKDEPQEEQRDPPKEHPKEPLEEPRDPPEEPLWEPLGSPLDGLAPEWMLRMGTVHGPDPATAPRDVQRLLADPPRDATPQQKLAVTRWYRGGDPSNLTPLAIDCYWAWAAQEYVMRKLGAPVITPDDAPAAPEDADENLAAVCAYSDAHSDADDNSPRERPLVLSPEDDAALRARERATVMAEEAAAAYGMPPPPPPPPPTNYERPTRRAHGGYLRWGMPLAQREGEPRRRVRAGPRVGHGRLQPLRAAPRPVSLHDTRPESVHEARRRVRRARLRVQYPRLRRLMRERLYFAQRVEEWYKEYDREGQP